MGQGTNGCAFTEMMPSLQFYLCPERRISFDGFVNYEGRRFGMPYSYRGATAWIMRKDDMIHIYSADLKQLLTTHDVTWSKRDRFCTDQYALPEQPEEFPSMPVKVEIIQLPEPEPMLSFDGAPFFAEAPLYYVCLRHSFGRFSDQGRRRMRCDIP